MFEDEEYLFSPRIDTILMSIGNLIVVLGFLYLLAHIIAWATGGNK